MDKIDWSKAPDGAKYAAWVAGAVIRPYVCWYRIIDGGWHYLYEDAEDCWRPCGTGSPAHKPLDPRPQTDNKEGEGVNLDAPVEGFHYINGRSLPPTHVECEMNAFGYWTRCTVLAYGERMFIYKISDNQFDDEGDHIAGENSYLLASTKFRPIKSHRDKVIEAAYDALDKRELGCCEWQEHARRIFEQLYRADMLKLPGEDQ